MQWQDEAVVMSARAHGESHAVVELMARNQGRCLGLVHGGMGLKKRPLIQPGNNVQALWRARLESQLGHFTLDCTQARAAGWMHLPSAAQAMALHAVSLLGTYIRLLPERDPHPEIYDALLMVLDMLHQPQRAAPAMVQFEVLLLQVLGYGLDLDRCAVTGVREGLTHVSPKSGRAVTQAVAAPYETQLLRLPDFLRADAPDGIALRDVADGAALTGLFFQKNIYAPQALDPPAARERFFKLGLAG